MQSNKNSIPSSSGSGDSESHKRTRKRIRKKIRKDQEEPRFENLDSQPEKSFNDSRDDEEEEKSPSQTPQSGYKRRSTFVVASDSNNGYMSDEISSNRSPATQSKQKEKDNFTEEVKAGSASKSRHKRVKLKVKKIDDEGVRHNFKI